jgi:flagellar hook-associated protein 1 FlgK
MGIGNAFAVGRSGLLSFQRVLNTTSHNISNVNTEGYSRQRTELSTRFPTPTPAGFVGNGVRVTTTQRMWDDHAANQVRNRESTVGLYSGYAEFAKQVDNILADQDAGFAPALEEFFVSVQGVADDPTSIPAREVMLTQGNAMTDRMHTMTEWLEQLRSAANDRIENKVVEINTLSKTLADMNQELITARGLGGQDQPPNDLLDRRDHVVDELSKIIGVTTLEQDDGSYNVYIGNGQALVLGTQYMELEARNDPNDPLNYQVAYIDKQSGNQRIPITDMLAGGGGDLGGVLSFRDEILTPSFNHLGRLSVALTMTFNSQHHEGMDMAGNLGTDFFTPYNSVASVQDYRNTPYAGTVSTTVVDPSLLTTDEYNLTYDGAGSYTLRNMSTNATTTLAQGAGPPWVLAPQVDGLEIDVSGPAAPNVGDTFFIRPLRGMSRTLEVDFEDPGLIAASRPIRTTPNLNNLGSASITEATVTDITNPNLLDEYRIEFRNSTGVPPLNADEYRLVPTNPAGPPAAWTAYTGNDLIALNGWEVTLTGDAWDGDSFDVTQNTNGFSDNSNALALADLQASATMISGNATYHDAYSELVVTVGNNTHRADISLKAQEALLVQAKDLKEGISGVNLDEEAANLLRYQQAYAAAAQVVVAADNMFQTLIAAVRGQ